MITIVVLMLAFVLLDMAALRWGTDSTEGLHSREWSRREYWGEKTS